LSSKPEAEDQPIVWLRYINTNSYAKLLLWLYFNIVFIIIKIRVRA